ncbi:TetR/AcrR family transcriptional regulator [Nesterenkonia halotolerans]|uniref:AcrR family transcriptional regulator n=1 Tax=Nesterenkonia halotolerans TaxID=225325 RepID=A0ABR9J9S6_9MICC|nr:TetR/AcrR family transcriptional regulator C-terminal domain-containing protein [Nesterenkonia halotolerans]MBE1515745.1 AcrR family transcriptional regulator [Nesterenkonia halotolerans]
MAAEKTSPRRRGRPTSPVLSRSMIAGRAMELVAERGYDHLTMAGLARKLGVSASALYNHVSSKHDVLVLIQDRLNEEIDYSAFDHQDWPQGLRHWAHSYRECYIEHTELIPLIAVLPIADAPQSVKMYEHVFTALHSAGVEQRDAVDIIVGIEALVFGAAFDASAPADIFDPGGLLEMAPAFAEAAALRAADARGSADRAFEMALDALIDGLRRRVSPERA